MTKVKSILLFVQQSLEENTHKLILILTVTAIRNLIHRAKLKTYIHKLLKTHSFRMQEQALHTLTTVL